MLSVFIRYPSTLYIFIDLITLEFSGSLISIYECRLYTNGFGEIAGFNLASIEFLFAILFSIPGVAPVSYTHLTLPTICSV